MVARKTVLVAVCESSDRENRDFLKKCFNFFFFFFGYFLPRFILTWAIFYFLISFYVFFMFTIFGIPDIERRKRGIFS